MGELARFHAGFASLELALNTIMAFALGKKQEVGHAILSRIRNIADRIEIIRGVSREADHLSEKQRLSIGLACDQAAALNARRNVYAHGLYEHRGDDIRITPFAYSPRNAQPELLKLERVKKDVEQIDAVMIATLLYANLIPEDLLVQLQASPETPQPPDGPTEPRT